MALLRPAYGFQPYSYSLRGLPQQAAGFGDTSSSSRPLSRFVVIRDRYGEQHAAELGDRESVRRAAEYLAEDLGLDRYDIVNVRVVRARDAGAARLMGTGATDGEAEQLNLFSEPAVEKPRRRGVSRKPGRIARCKIVLITRKSGKKVRRKLCWDKHGVLAANTKPGARRGKSARKVVCKRKCPKGSRAVCKGGYRKVKGKRVCKKFICRREGA